MSPFTKSPPPFNSSSEMQNHSLLPSRRSTPTWSFLQPWNLTLSWWLQVLRKAFLSSYWVISLGRGEKKHVYINPKPITSWKPQKMDGLLVDTFLFPSGWGSRFRIFVFGAANSDHILLAFLQKPRSMVQWLMTNGSIWIQAIVFFPIKLRHCPLNHDYGGRDYFVGDLELEHNR